MKLVATRFERAEISFVDLTSVVRLSSLSFACSARSIRKASSSRDCCTTAKAQSRRVVANACDLRKIRLCANGAVAARRKAPECAQEFAPAQRQKHHIYQRPQFVAEGVSPQEKQQALDLILIFYPTASPTHPATHPLKPDVDERWRPSIMPGVDHCLEDFSDSRRIGFFGLGYELGDSLQSRVVDARKQ